MLEFGPNRVESLPLEPLWLKFLKGFTHFFALILWFAAVLAFVAEWRAPLHLTAGEQVLYTKGALQTVMPLCTHIETESGVVALDAEKRESMLRAEQQLAGQGLRVLAFASRRVAQGESAAISWNAA